MALLRALGGPVSLSNRTCRLQFSPVTLLFPCSHGGQPPPRNGVPSAAGVPRLDRNLPDSAQCRKEAGGIDDPDSPVLANGQEMPPVAGDQSVSSWSQRCSCCGWCTTPPRCNAGPPDQVLSGPQSLAYCPFPLLRCSSGSALDTMDATSEPPIMPRESSPVVSQKARLTAVPSASRIPRK